MPTRDENWEVDLLWQHLHETGSPGRPTEGWYKEMDPTGTLDDPRHVYEMLVGEPSHTNPDLAQLPASMIPWNQRNAGIIKVFKTELACGSVVKLTFRKYMGWGRNEPNSRSVNYRGWNAVNWIVQSLRAGKPVRAYLKAKNHYIGIVGFQGRSVHPEAPKTDAFMRFDFLCIDPWAGGAATGTTTIVYAGATTKFLGIARQDGTKLMYDGYEITDVEGSFPF
ncbi:MAG: hypothetical protein ACREXX_00645 [Gammaproteobacteria bacterium]